MHARCGEASGEVNFNEASEEFGQLLSNGAKQGGMNLRNLDKGGGEAAQELV